MLEIKDLQKVVKRHTVLDIPTFTLDAGEITAIVGPADSGLEPLRQLLTGRQRPTAGSVRMNGLRPADHHQLVSQQVGVLFADDALFASRSPQANLDFHARLRGLPSGRVEEVLQMVGLADHARSKLDQLSSGLRRRLAFGVAVLHNPLILLLVDPFVRCDEPSITLLSQLISDYAANGGAILILADSNAYLTEICDVVYQMESGRIVAAHRPREERAAARPFKIPVKLEGRIALINPADILYIVAENGRTMLHTTAEPFLSQFTLAELENRLGRSGFFRAHRSFLVNLQHVTEVIPYTRSSFSLRLDDPKGTLVPLSKDAAQELRTLFDY
ncbi:MAG: LytTR family transcriptional regulator DNA-binding domain-containing protein [Ardenticatenaceae bacterium]|nr:LytTR family transcriptional regulator DNA-binding domain-containing protein [Ardenticatenaceae bacterium]